VTDPHRVTQEAVLTSFVETLRAQIVPALDDRWARSAAIQLAALAQLLRDRSADPSERRAEEIGAVLGTSTSSYPDALTAAAEAFGRFGEDDEQRRRLRALLIRHLDEDLADNMPLLAAFRGQMPGA